MRRGLIAILLAVCGGSVGAQTPEWPALPAEVEQLNRTAGNAASPAAAAKLYAEALRLQPNNGPALYGLGWALLEQDRAAESLKILRKLDQLTPYHPETLAAMATALARLPNLRRAQIAEGLDYATRAVELRSDSPAAWHILSVLHHANGDYAAAAEAAIHSVTLASQQELDPDLIMVYQQQELACFDALAVFSPLE